MGRISQWAVRQPWWALVTWIALMAAIIVLSIQFGGEYNDDFELPDTESTTAQELLSELSGSAGTGSGLEGQIVWSPDDESVPVTDDAVQQPMTAVMTEVSKSEGVLCVVASLRRPARHRLPRAAADRRRGRPGRTASRGGAARRGAVGGRAGRHGALRPRRRQSRRPCRLRDGHLRGRDLRRPRQRAHSRLARAHRGAERSGRPAGRRQRRLRVRLGRGAVVGEHRCRGRARHPALRLRCAGRGPAADRLRGRVRRDQHRFRPAAGRRPARRRPVRADPGVDDRSRCRHRLLAVRHQPLSRSDHPRTRAARGGAGVRPHVRTRGAVRRSHGDHRAARPVRDADQLLQRHRGRVRSHRVHGDGRARCCSCRPCSRCSAPGPSPDAWRGSPTARRCRVSA